MFLLMDTLSFLRFAPVPLKIRHDGWSPDLQLRFIVALARGATPAEAARRVGKSRQTAYALRKRKGAEEFAAAWDAALHFAREARMAAASAPRPSPAPPPELRRHADIAAMAALRARLAARSGPAADPGQDRRAFDALLDRLYPRQAGEADKADRADRADNT